MSEQRRLAAILVADVVGYSKLVGADEAGTLAKLAAMKRELIEPAIGKHSGRLFKAVGDGFLVEFASAVQAVICAVDIQKSGPALALRIGIHLGDVVVQGDDLMGDGVNIAARIEGIAEPGGIAISRQVRDQVRDRLDVALIDKGEVALKNIARPVRIFTVGGAKATAPVLALPDKPSIAVLPFQNMSGDPDQEYFADGIVEDIITALSRFKSLFVIARNSSFTYKGRAVDIKQVGRELGVRYVLEGSVRKAGGRVRITGQLIEAETGAHVWADRFDGDLTDIFELQDRVTVSVVGAMVPKLDLAEIERAKRKPVGSLDAYDVFLRGMGKLYELKPGTWEEANTLFRRAIDLDPSFATPYGLAARCLSVRKTRGLVVDPAADEAEVRRLAARAAAVGHEDAIALAWAGHSLMFVCHELDKGGAMVEEAVGINPNSATVWQLKGSVSMYRGNHELAVSELQRALRMNPVGPDSFHIEQTMAAALLFLGRYAECQQWCDRVLTHLPTSTLAMQMSASAHVLAGEVERGRRVMRDILKLRPDMTIANQKDVHPMRRSEDRAVWVEGLRQAGLPEGPSGGLALPDKPSIAVLPFQNMSGDPEQEYFADGVVEDIITALSRFKSLFVIARNSSFTYKGRAVDIKQVGRELGVRYVLEGSVRKAGGRVRITGQLIEVASNIHLWADRFEGPMDDIFALQDKVTSGVVGIVEPTIQRSEVQRALVKPTVNLSAYDFYLRGVPNYNKWTKEANEEAYRLFSAALELDPHYAAALIQLAYVHAQRWMQNWTDDRQREALDGNRLKERALEVAKDDPFVLAGSAYLHIQFGGDTATAVSLIDRAMKLNPNSSLALEMSTWIRVRGGEPELAIEHCLRAMRLNPFNQTNTPLAIAYFLLGREQEAVACIDEALINAPRALPALRFAATIKAGFGRLEEARQLVKRILEINPNARLTLGPWGPEKPEYKRKWAEARKALVQLGLPE